VSGTKPKTRDRILQAALALFNEEGEAQVSTIHIAAVLDISPGNLYYHFKGKEAIIEALFEEFEVEIRQVLAAPIKRPLSIDDNWIFTYIIFEEINDFRFFYRNISGILERCPSLRPRVLRLMRLKEETAAAILNSLRRYRVIDCTDTERNALAVRLAAHMTFWLQYVVLTTAERNDRMMIQTGVYSAIMMLAPFAIGGRAEFMSKLDSHLSAQH
jgi:AcrR family transcriptional regulator